MSARAADTLAYKGTPAIGYKVVKEEANERMSKVEAAAGRAAVCRRRHCRRAAPPGTLSFGDNTSETP
jgi:hypothetical protein